jgi:hypothetical protein
LENPEKIKDVVVEVIDDDNISCDVDNRRFVGEYAMCRCCEFLQDLERDNWKDELGSVRVIRCNTNGNGIHVKFEEV